MPPPRPAPRLIATAVLVALLVTLAAACAPATRLTIGETLEDLGQAFLATASTWDQARREGLVTAEEYARFVTAARAFQAAWRRAYDAWQAGEDPAALRAQLDALRQELTLWALRLAERRRSP